MPTPSPAAAPPLPALLTLPRSFGDYELLAELGRGAAGGWLLGPRAAAGEAPRAARGGRRPPPPGRARAGAGPPPVFARGAPPPRPARPLPPPPLPSPPGPPPAAASALPVGGFG